MRTNCKLCGQVVQTVTPAGLCSSCADLETPAATVERIVADVDAAGDLDEIIAVLARYQPPSVQMEQAVLREKLLKAMKGKAASPAKIIDAWIGSAPKHQDDEYVAAEAGVMVNLALRHSQLFHDPTGEPYATIQIGHRETHHVRKRGFALWLRKLWYDLYRERANVGDIESLADAFKEALKPRISPAPSAQAIRDAIAQLESLAVFEGDEHKVHVRVAPAGDHVYIDLGDEDWQAIEVNSKGWRVVRDHGIRFVRAPGALALPVPKPDGDISDLRRFVNVTDDEWPLLAGFVVGLFMPSGPYPVLNLLGEQGSAKTSSARFVRRLIDPYSPLDRGRPRSEHELAISAEWGWCLSYDNLGAIPDWLSDAFCRISTGGGFGARMLYTDDEERRFDACRPILINGITDIATRGDLLDRSIVLTLPPIEVRDQAELDAEWEKAWPSLFGACLDAVVVALMNREQVTLSAVPRMADFARWATAAESGLDLAEGSFLTAYLANREHGRQTVVESDPVAEAVINLMGDRDFWTGTATQLLDVLTWRTSESVRRSNGWPKAPHALSGRLRRLAPDLRSVGVDVAWPSSHWQGRTLTITRRASGEDDTGMET